MNGKDRKGLSPMDIVAVLTRVVQEQEQTIEKLQENFAKLQHEMQLIKSTNITAQR